jgi:hypothetical protein
MSDLFVPENGDEFYGFLAAHCYICEHDRNCTIQKGAFASNGQGIEYWVLDDEGLPYCNRFAASQQTAANESPTVTIVRKLAQVQQELHAPKSQRNTFGNYNYRSCEDILQAVKPLLADGCVITISDDIVANGERVYVKATAKFTDGEQSIETTAYARETLERRGMDDAQITGSASSYARKYALNGLLLIDDNKDADTRDNAEEHALTKRREEIEFLVDGEGLREAFNELMKKSKKPFAKYGEQELLRIEAWIKEEKQ